MPVPIDFHSFSVPAPLDPAPTVEHTALTTEPDFTDIDCECMLCDLPIGWQHEPVEWRVTLDFPGPYPTPGVTHMLLCEHCKGEWVDTTWYPPYDNFTVVRCVKVRACAGAGR